jgi:sugar lactone lactonase YvrE
MCTPWRRAWSRVSRPLSVPTIALGGPVTPEGNVGQVADDLAFPNGMAISPDGGTLIVAESYGNRLTAYDISSDGGLASRRVWAETPR